MFRSLITDQHLAGACKCGVSDHAPAHELGDFAHALVALQPTDAGNCAVRLLQLFDAVVMVGLSGYLGLVCDGQYLAAA